MRRHRKRSTPAWLAAPLWAAAIVLACWGLWQFAQFRRTLIAQGQGAAPVPEAGIPTDGRSTAAAPLATNAQNFSQLSSLDPPQDDSGFTSFAPAGAPPKNVEELMAQGTAMLDAGRIVEGRDALNSLLGALGEDPRAEAIRQQLTDLNAGVLLGTAILPEDPAARLVDIRHGDSFLKLGRQYQVPAAFLEEINPQLNPRNLRPMTGVKIVRGPFNLRLVKHVSRLDLFARELYVRSFYAVVEDGNYLPRGDYRVKTGAKIDLGVRRWVGFEGCDSGTREIDAGWIYGSAGMCARWGGRITRRRG